MRAYIYCTKAKPYLFKYFFNGDEGAGWNYETSYCKEEFIDDSPTLLNGKVVASFELNNVEEIACETLHNGISEVPIYYTDSVDDLDNSKNNACVFNQDLIDYFGIKKGGKVVGFAWHIDDLKILDKPMDIRDFGLTRAPQSWCYAYDSQGNRCIIISIQAVWVEKILNGEKTIEIRKTYPKEVGLNE